MNENNNKLFFRHPSRASGCPSGLTGCPSGLNGHAELLKP